PRMDAHHQGSLNANSRRLFLPSRYPRRPFTGGVPWHRGGSATHLRGVRLCGERPTPRAICSQRYRVKGISDPLEGKISEMRVVSWNINFPGRKTAKRQGDLLRELSSDLMHLQEVNPGSSEVLRAAAGADWMVRAIDLRTPKPDDLPVLWHSVAVAGR